MLQECGFLCGRYPLLSESGENGFVDILSERKHHSFPLDFFVQNHLSCNSTGISHSLGHGCVAIGVSILDHVDSLQFPPVVRPLDGDLVSHEDHVSLPLPVQQPLIQVVAQLQKGPDFRTF